MFFQIKGKPRNAILLILIVISLLVFYTINSIQNNSKRTFYSDVDFNNASLCYTEPEESKISYFSDILDHNHKPTNGKSIFFLETSCSQTGIVKLNPRQACAIESTAKRNPNREIFVLFVSPVGVNEDEALPHFIEILQEYPNIHLRNVNLWRFTYDTPVFEWLKTNQLFESQYVAEHMSDILKMVILYKYGGFYLDQDVIVQKSFDNLGDNFIGDDWGQTIGSSLIHLNNNGIGLELTARYLSKVIEEYDAINTSGKSIITHILADICSTKDRTLWTRERCSGFGLQPKKLFHPIPKTDFSKYWDQVSVKDVLKLTKGSTLIHFWNDVIKKNWFEIGARNAHQAIAKQNCPNIYKKSTEF